VRLGGAGRRLPDRRDEVCEGSVALQESYPVHVPFTQNRNAPHALPQPPQLVGSVSTSTHAPLQSFVFEPHTHVPDWQTAPAPHVLPHAPQLVGSIEVSVHSPPQYVSPTRHAHEPPLQD